MKTVRFILLYIFSFLLIFYTFSCQHESPDPDEFPEVCFEEEILPVFKTSCAISGCHDRPGGESGYDFRDYSGIIKAVTPFEPEKSPAYTSLSLIWGEAFMPPDQPLSLQNRSLIRLWILQGAGNTRCIDSIMDDSASVNPRACFERDIFPYIQSGCALSGCHDDITAKEGYRFTSYSGILKAVSPGQPSNSELFKAITAIEERMPPPPRDPLPEEVIDSVYAWIIYGALNENCGIFCDTTSEITYTTVVEPLIRKFCLGCHSGTNPSGNISLGSYAVVNSLAAENRFTGVLRGRGTYPVMPPAGPLDECRIRQVELWIENGMPE